MADAYLLKASYGDLSKKEAQVLAAPSIERALQLDPELADARASLGIMRLYEGSLELAEASLVEATRLNPYHAMALMWLGCVLQEQGRIDEAHDPFSRAYALDPEHPTVAENFVNSMLLRGDNAQARAVLTGTQQSMGLLKLAAMTALEQGDWERASTIAETLKSEGEELAGHLILWRLYTKRSKWSLAAHELKISETIAPESVDVYLTALEHLALTEKYGVLLAKIANWSGVNPAKSAKEHKVSVIEQAWRGVALARGGRFEEAATLLQNGRYNWVGAMANSGSPMARGNHCKRLGLIRLSIARSVFPFRRWARRAVLGHVFRSSKTGCFPARGPPERPTSGEHTDGWVLSS